jgi:hypothetical protein
MDGWMVGWVGGWMDGWVGGWMDGWREGETDREREREENRIRNIVELERTDHWGYVSLGGLFFFFHWLYILGWDLNFSGGILVPK